MKVSQEYIPVIVIGIITVTSIIATAVSDSSKPQKEIPCQEYGK